MELRHPFNLPAELVLMILDHLSLLDYFSISGVSLQARSFVLPTLHALTPEDRLHALKRATEDDHHGAILVLLSILDCEITEPEHKFFILRTLFRSSYTKAMGTWLNDLAPSPPTDHEWRKEANWKETFMRSNRTEALDTCLRILLSAICPYRLRIRRLRHRYIALAVKNRGKPAGSQRRHGPGQ
ncbi:hypothetical protein ASPVEDRAFT_72324 [Aspergillus versicolor CBS 583.65]|uniref:F-box domain-containing protein n=1 Tax=Aspergillus versicolor CBS 583.65 TaxID=1036611 RepID=A0A1L9PLS0_ASPVE|nr:uncharacterized protein ASPVEDRAFT_72324 [Aspergillus versicolor CBS 583.65]OJJ02484.1 hypothetical protein ASPVEDRAFT_72324 [Aspergillus versicolor CBS 583.65]